MGRGEQSNEEVKADQPGSELGLGKARALCLCCGAGKVVAGKGHGSGDGGDLERLSRGTEEACWGCSSRNGKGCEGVIDVSRKGQGNAVLERRGD